MNPNTELFLANQQRFFNGSFEDFKAFGGPCVYFHQAALAAAAEEFLSIRHIELIYATLTAWGMHRMGDVTTTMTKLTEWQEFHDSIVSQKQQLLRLRNCSMQTMSKNEFSEVIAGTREIYNNLRISRSASSVVANSKALHHLLPHLVPPIDRQYTVRFFRHQPEAWLNKKGQFKAVMLPAGMDAQFNLFQDICTKIWVIVSRTDPSIFQEQYSEHGVTVPKVIDNAILRYVRQHAGDVRNRLHLPAPIIEQVGGALTT